MKKQVLVVCLLWCARVMHGAPIVSGDVVDGTSSFSFPVKAHAFDPIGAVFFVGAAQAVPGNSFAVAAAYGMNFIALAPEFVSLNNISQQPDPLFGSSLQFISLAGSYPFVVTAQEPNILYFYRAYGQTKNITLLSSGVLPDMAQQPSAGIVGVAGFMASGEQTVGHLMYAAVKNNAGSFGQVGSGILQLQVQAQEITENEQKIIQYFIVLTARTALDVTTPALAISSQITSIDNDVAGEPVALDVHSFKQLYTSNPQEAVKRIPPIGLLYTGLLVTGAPGALDGARAVTLQGDQPIVDASVIGVDSIIGGVGSSIQVSIHQVKTLYTSTNLDYLVVVGGVGAPAATKRQVFALPLINDSTATGFGTLAKKDAMPIDIFETTAPYRFQQRVLRELPAAAGDLYTSTDTEARVGGDGTLPGDIVECFVSGDSIFVTCAAGNCQQGGIFYSQALFDQYGRVKGWTDWQRAGASGAIWGSALDTRNTAYWLMQGVDANSVFTVARTVWTDTDNGFVSFVNRLFTQDNYGIQGALDLPWQHPIFDQTNGSRSSLFLATGNKQVAFIQSGVDQSGFFTPQESFTTVFESQDGTTTGFAGSAQAMVFTGGVLEQLGALTSAAVAVGDTAWFAVGGHDGVAVCAHADGTGVTLPLEPNFTSFDTTLSFVRISDLANVKRLYAQDNKLCILTLDTLCYVMLTPEGIVSGLDPIVLASRADNPELGYLQDVCSSGGNLLLATSTGLWQSSCGGDWTQIMLNESPGAATRLYPHSPTLISSEVATARTGGTVDVLTAYPGYHQARVYRFTAIPGQTGDTTYVQLPDYFVENLKTFYINVGHYANGLFTDGALYYFTRSAYKPTNSTVFVQSLPAEQRLIDRRFIMSSAVAQSPLSSKLSCAAVIRRSASGALFIAGNSGLDANQ